MHPVPVAHEKKPVWSVWQPRCSHAWHPTSLPTVTALTPPPCDAVLWRERSCRSSIAVLWSQMRELTFTRQPMLKMWDADTDKPSFSCRHFVAMFHGRHPRPLAVLLYIWSTFVPLCTPGPRNDIQCIYHLIRMRIFFDTFSLFYPSLCYYVNFWQQWVEEYWST